MKAALLQILIAMIRRGYRLAGKFSFRGAISRTLTLALIAVVCVGGFLSLRGTMPFMPVFGISMEPVLHAGDLIIIEEMNPDDVLQGDIIVFTVPAAVREHYNYPQVVAHRVVDVRNIQGIISFRTAGDNTGEDPFTVRPQDIRGLVGKRISYLGFPLLFFQSQQGLIFLVVALILLALYLYSDEISRGKIFVHRSIFAPVIQESRRNNRELEQRMEQSEKGINDTQKALTSFAEAISEYAQHLKSHTSAIQGLSEASHELKKGAAEQNRVLARLLENMEKQNTPPPAPSDEFSFEAEKPEAAETIRESKTYPPGCYRSRSKEPREEEEILGAG